MSDSNQPVGVSTPALRLIIQKCFKPNAFGANAPDRQQYNYVIGLLARGSSILYVEKPADGSAITDNQNIRSRSPI